jgi:hypothetical protein
LREVIAEIERLGKVELTGHRLCVVFLSLVSPFRLGPFRGLGIQERSTQPRRPPPQAGPPLTAQARRRPLTLGGGATVPRGHLPNWSHLR